MSATLPTSDRRETAGARAARAAVSKCEAAIDAELVRRFNAGDDAAFVGIVQRHQPKIFPLVLGLIRNHADAEELTQDTFIRAHRALAHFRGDSSLATWLNRIAVNLARNRYWYFFRRRRHDAISLDSPLGDAASPTLNDLIASEAPAPSREVATVEFSALIAACMEKLDARHREILTLRNTRNYSYGEIARALYLNVGTVKSRVARARERLRFLLAERCPEFSPDSAPSEWFEPARGSGHPAAA